MRDTLWTMFCTGLLSATGEWWVEVKRLLRDGDNERHSLGFFSSRIFPSIHSWTISKLVYFIFITPLKEWLHNLLSWVQLTERVCFYDYKCKSANSPSLVGNRYWSPRLSEPQSSKNLKWQMLNYFPNFKNIIFIIIMLYIVLKMALAWI